MPGGFLRQLQFVLGVLSRAQTNLDAAAPHEWRQSAAALVRLHLSRDLPVPQVL